MHSPIHCNKNAHLSVVCSLFWKPNVFDLNVTLIYIILLALMLIGYKEFRYMYLPH